MILQDLMHDINLHGFYRTAYPRRFVGSKPFIRTTIERAREIGCWVVLTESESHLYATVHDVARMRGDRLSAARAVESSAK